MAATDTTTTLRREALASGLVLVLACGLVAALATGSPGGVARASLVPVALAISAGPSLALHPLPTLGLANRITLVRAVVVAALASLAGEEVPPLALFALGSAAFFLDWLDGRVARATGCASAFGARLDMELDAIFVFVLSALAVGLGHGWWVLSAGLARYVWVGAGRVWPWLAAELPPDPWRPWACGVGITLFLGSLLPLPALASAFLAGAGALVIVHSFLRDLVFLWRR
ncbi:MAG: CDP-alcohol phosphatidyltransferase family protein [Alphaproteobacteria bacterium]|nr:CDP-alcohol phosphatidyltransferase family protein [Alphaproteobacteria bacterium]